MNRYTNLTPAKFDPLSLQEIMMVPLGRQRQHEEQQQQAEAMGLFDVNRLSPDDERIKSQIDDFKGQITGLQDELFSSGTSRGLSKKLMELKRKRDTFLSNDGEGGKAQNAFNAFQANMKAIRDNKNINEADKQLYIQAALRDYKGLDTGYSPYYGADSIDIRKRGEEIASKMSPQEITQITGWTKNSNGTWTNGTTTTKTLPPSAIENVVRAALLSDRAVTSYIEALNYSTGQDHSYLLGNSAIVAGGQQQRNDYEEKEDMKFPPEWMANTGSGFDGVHNYNTISPPMLSRFNQPQSKDHSILQKIKDGKNHSGVDFLSRPSYKEADGSINPNYSEELKMWKEAKEQGGKPFSMEDLTPAGKLEFEEIAEGLKINGNLAQNATEDEVLDAVLNYKNKYSKPFESDPKIISDISMQLGKYSSGIKSGDMTNALRQLNNDAPHQLLMDPESGKVTSFSDIAGKGGKISMIRGYVDADNDLPQVVGLNEDTQYHDKASHFVSPMMVQVTNEEGEVIGDYYITRNQGQRHSKRYKADAQVNKIGSIRNRPNIPHKVEIAGKGYEIKYLDAETIQNKVADAYEVLVDETTGQLKPESSMTPEEIQLKRYIQNIQTSQEGPTVGLFEWINTDTPGDKVSQIESFKAFQTRIYNENGVENY